MHKRHVNTLPSRKDLCPLQKSMPMDKEAQGTLAVLVQSLFHYSLSHELLNAFWELLLTHRFHWPPGTGPQDFYRALY